MPKQAIEPGSSQAKKRAAIGLRNLYAKVASAHYPEAWSDTERMIARSFLLRISRAKGEIEDALTLLGYEIRPDESVVGYSIMKLRR